jgi:hypothetical protein
MKAQGKGAGEIEPKQNQIGILGGIAGGWNQAPLSMVYVAVHKPSLWNDLGRTADRDYRCRARDADSEPAAAGV